MPPPLGSAYPQGFYLPLRIGLGQWLGQFYADFYADTQALAEWAARGQATAMAWAAGRMDNAVNDMLSAWRRNNNSGGAATSAYLPVVFAAIGREYQDSPSEAGRHALDWIPFTFPDDTENRSFRMRLLHADVRAQIVVVAQDPMSAASICGQLAFHCERIPRFNANYVWNGFTTPMSVQVVPSDRLAAPDAENPTLTILTMDLTLRTLIPLFRGDTGPTVGYPVVETIEHEEADPNGPPPEGVTAEAWAKYREMTSRGAPAVYLAGVKVEG
jgi:hypothetical protein